MSSAKLSSPGRAMMNQENERKTSVDMMNSSRAAVIIYGNLDYQLRFTLKRSQFVRLGEHTLSSNPDCNSLRCAPQPQDLDAESVISHEAYRNPCRYCNDIALIKLAQPAQLHTISVMPACLPLNPEQDMGFSVEEFEGKVAVAAGWGSTSRDPLTFDLPDTLQEVNLPIQKLPYCSNLLVKYAEPTMIVCAGGSGHRDTCKGDSGGPLTLTNVFGTVTFAVGITSVGPLACGSNNTQGLYTSVHHYIPWILQTMHGRKKDQVSGSSVFTASNVKRNSFINHIATNARLGTISAVGT
ncbi:glandular kallikrein-3, submandibular-like [Oratosquilla oratoria]|uniref:glandular kallikrein-3, submandibular-like n=1 Tax=Oratosquilla oratoria TaxID=337810 RepID=UPI003F772E9A